VARLEQDKQIKPMKVMKKCFFATYPCLRIKKNHLCNQKKGVVYAISQINSVKKGKSGKCHQEAEIQVAWLDEVKRKRQIPPIKKNSTDPERRETPASHVGGGR